MFHVNRIVVFTMFLDSNRKIGVEKLIPIVKLFLMSIRDIFEMLNSRIQGKGIHFVHCSGRSAGVASVASCDRTLRIQSEDLPLTVKAKKNCRSVIAKLFEENPLWLFLSLISRVLWDWYTAVYRRDGTVTIEDGLRAISQLFNLSIPSYYFSANSQGSKY